MGRVGQDSLSFGGGDWSYGRHMGGGWAPLKPWDPGALGNHFRGRWKRRVPDKDLILFGLFSLGWDGAVDGAGPRRGDFVSQHPLLKQLGKISDTHYSI